MENDRRKNFTFALSGGGVAFVGIIIVYFVLISPIQNHQTEKFLLDCQLRGLECTIESNWLVPFGMAVIPFMVFASLYHHLETKRTKTWRSYK